jgi:hypothetical protein
MSTGPTSILRKCPWCKELTRTEDGRFVEHPIIIKTGRKSYTAETCQGSGKPIDPMRIP